MAVDLLLQACEAIAGPHRHPPRHQGIELLHPQPEQAPHLKVLDFGIARPRPGR
jgi:hypothetical protein